MTGSRHLIEEAQRNLERARAEVRTARFAEKRAMRHFADGKTTFGELREAIRALAFAEQRVTSLAAIELNIRHLYRSQERTK